MKSQKDGAEQVMHEGLGAGSPGQSHPHIKFSSILSLIGLNLANPRHALTGNSSLLVSGANSQINPSGGAQSPLAMAFQQHRPLLPHQVPNPSTKLLFPALPVVNWAGKGSRLTKFQEASELSSSPLSRECPQCPAVTHQEQEVVREQFHLQLHHTI